MTNKVIVSPYFKRRIKQLRKHYRHIREDIQPLINELENGKTPGDQIKATKHTVYKASVANRDARRGKSGGYRIIYYLYLENQIVLLTIYSKSDQEDITHDEIMALINALPEE